ncbi:glycoside hydrolase family 16 protein [Sinomonas terrae]|uniref:Glycoside hydrolase family 16 protein n=1 Tax=Sinomonas terrae TaxID=2908838 RepID=A0ABS9TWX6_9MICC|nr:glycoside hydrolase family 16 protein [Sinomonas terrae]MCH6468913.1 glycoside hydrolase family 16 protein [Sinomonas terrae]
MKKEILAFVTSSALMFATLAATFAIGTPAVGATTSSTDGTQAAVVLGWGPVINGDEFNYVGAPDPTKWRVYSSPGQNGNGIRTPKAWYVNGSVAQVTGDSSGNTGGMSAIWDRNIAPYQRIEARMRTNQRDPQYHPVLILWPDSNTGCSEIDYAEGTQNTTQMHFWLHYPTCGLRNSSTVTIDTTQWHNYAVEWSRSGIRGWIDGVLWFSDTSAAAQSMTVPMHETVQLDWFPAGYTTPPQLSWMQVDWIRQYAPPSQ